nr:MAG TPA: hypothetical protein [Caudoviricetes sp.]
MERWHTSGDAPWTNLSGDSTRPAILAFEAQGGNASSWELYS